MENKLEQLLNSLIKKGWKPFGESRIEEIKRAEQYAGNWNWCCWGGSMQRRKSTRQLVSKESGLWQFVCENGYIREIETDGLEIRNWDNPKHWIVESALCDEDKLEDFILDNIVIKDEK